MDRAIPTGSKICSRREEQRRHELHKQRVKAVRPLVDNSEPHVAHLEHVRNNLKREQMLEDRYSEIDRENRILLKKMSEIMTAGGSQQPPPPTRPVERQRPPGPLSLNRDARKKELLRITQENQLILRRIQQAQPVYNHVEMEGTHRRNLSYLRNCAEYPLVLRTPRSARGPGGSSHFSSQLVPLGEEAYRPLSARSLSHSGRAPQSAPAAPQLPYPMGAAAAPQMGGGGGYSPSPQHQQGYAQSTTPQAFSERSQDNRPISSSMEGEAVDAESMFIYKMKGTSAGSVNAEIQLGSTIGDTRVRVRGLTPSSPSEGGAP